MTGLWLISYIALWILFVVMAILMISVLHNLGAIYESLPRLDSAPTKLKATEPLPTVLLSSLTSGEPVALADFVGKGIAISIVKPDCAPCIKFLETVADNGVSPDPLDPTITRRLIIGIGSAEKIADMVSATSLPPDIPVLIDSKDEVIAKWGISATPMSVIVNDDLKVVRQIFAS